MQGQKRKMQGRHKKLFLGSLRASRAIKNYTELTHLFWPGVPEFFLI